MNSAEVLALLEENKNPRGIANWDKLEDSLSSFGIGLTQLRKLAKKVGRNHDLAQELWASDNYDAKVIGLLIGEPKKLTREQAETQVEQLNHGMLAHVFSSCDATLAKASFSAELASDWIHSDDPIRRACGYGLLYEESKNKKKSAPEEAWFLAHVAHMSATWREEDTDGRMAIAGALIGVGKRTKAINAAALEVATAIGPITFSDTCDAFDARKHLVSPALKKKLGI